MNKHNELQLYLASGSPRRYELLAQLGYRFEVLRLDVPERREEGEKAQDYVCRLARDKAMAGVAAAPTMLPVLGADTIVVLGDRVLEKPSDLLDAKDMLEALSGKVHQVMTAVALATPDRCDVRLVTTNVAFRKLDEAEIEAYWRTGEPWGYEVKLPAGFNASQAGRTKRRPLSQWLAQGVVRVDGKSEPATVSNEAGDADCRVKVSMADFTDIASGKQNPQMAFMMGKSRGVAMRMMEPVSMKAPATSRMALTINSKRNLLLVRFMTLCINIWGICS